METTILVAITELRHTANKPGTLEERLKATMLEAKNHWLVTDDDERFRSAIGAVLLESTEEEQARINSEMRVLNVLSAAMRGVGVDWSALEAEADNEPLGLVQMWKAL